MKEHRLAATRRVAAMRLVAVISLRAAPLRLGTLLRQGQPKTGLHSETSQAIPKPRTCTRITDGLAMTRDVAMQTIISTVLGHMDISREELDADTFGISVVEAPTASGSTDSTSG
jgi:hypothetical protein